MNRCHPRRALLALAASLAFPVALYVAPQTAAAQLTIVREAPKDVVLGKMTVLAAPSIEVDGKPDRLSPGARIRDVRNFLVLPGNLNGQTVPVLYRREATTGLVHEAWLLTADEYSQLAKASSPKGSAGVQQFLAVLAALWAARP
jgi:hypothetical protein